MLKTKSSLNRLRFRFEEHPPAARHVGKIATIYGLAVFLMLGGCFGTALAEEQNASLDLKLIVELVDGSRLIGEPNLETISMATPYATMEIALEQVRHLVLHKGHESASCEMLNGDKLTGVLDLGKLKLQTLCGKITVPIHTIKKIEVISNADAMVRFEIDSSGNIHDRLKNLHFKRPVTNLGPYYESGKGWKTVDIDVRKKILTDGKQHDYVVSLKYYGGADCCHVKNFYLIIDGVRYKDMRPVPPKAGYNYLSGAEKPKNPHHITGFITGVPALDSCKSAKLVFELSDDVYPDCPGTGSMGTSAAIGFSETVHSDGSGTPVSYKSSRFSELPPPLSSKILFLDSKKPGGR